MIFRIDTLYKVERGKEASQAYIYIFEEDNQIVGVILSDGDFFNSSIKNGYENIFPQMLDLSEKELLPLFEIQNIYFTMYYIRHMFIIILVKRK